MTRGDVRLVLLRCGLVSLIGLAGCVSSSVSGGWGRHFEAARWGDAIVAQADKPDQLALELGLLGAAAGLAVYDHDIQDEAVENRVFTEGSTANGDGVIVGLTALALGSAGADWIGGDGGHAAEVLLESFLLTQGMTDLLKYTVNRERPGKQDLRSFPSGHTSFAFTMATFLQRRIADSYDGWVGSLGYLAYAPAAYAAIDRVEANKHWPSDVAFGAFLGVFLTNVVYDVHYGAPGRPGLFGVDGLSVEQTLDGNGAGVAMVLRF